MKHKLITLALGLLLLAQAFAGDDQKPLKIGDPIPGWSNLPGVDGKKHALADLKDKDVIVVVFTCNSCPIAVGYEDRLMAFQKKHCGPGKKVALIAINVNVIPEDRMPQMIERAKFRGFEFPYLFDETQKIAKDFDADMTPEFFVFGKNRKLVFRGAMDNTSIAANVKDNYLDPAVAAALKGERPKVDETIARGCRIRYVRKRP
ncbi:MAG: thioredoxin family protein [Gemmataceae bacterium]|nr:thioredoxin family protein [Gemmataceae bacterium]